MTHVGLTEPTQMREDLFPTIPEGYRRTWPKAASERLGDDLLNLCQEHSVQVVTPIWRVQSRHTRFRATKPIAVKMHYEDSFYFAENETLRITGTGQTPQEATSDFLLHLIHFYQYYIALLWDKVTGDATNLKKQFETLFVEE